MKIKRFSVLLILLSGCLVCLPLLAALQRLNNNAVSFGTDSWDDMLVPLTAVKVGNENPPHFISFRKNPAGTSTGVYLYGFDSVQEEQVFFTVQMPHSWRVSSAIKPHIHGSPTTADSGTIRFGLEYTKAPLGSNIFPTTTTIYTTATAVTAQYQEEYHAFPDITMAGETVSTIINCRLFRDVANDNYGADYAVSAIDFHFIKDGIGSDNETSKSF